MEKKLTMTTTLYGASAVVRGRTPAAWNNGRLYVRVDQADSVGFYMFSTANKLIWNKGAVFVSDNREERPLRFRDFKVPPIEREIDTYGIHHVDAVSPTAGTWRPSVHVFDTRSWVNKVLIFTHALQAPITIQASPIAQDVVDMFRVYQDNYLRTLQPPWNRPTDPPAAPLITNAAREFCKLWKLAGNKRIGSFTLLTAHAAQP